MTQQVMYNMKLIHEDGTIVDFNGYRIPDSGIHVNRFVVEWKTNHPVIVVSFDSKKNHQYWTCSCGGKTLPYQVCNHLKNLEITVAERNTLVVLTEQEYEDFGKGMIDGTLLEIQISAITEKFDKQMKKLANQLMDMFPQNYEDIHVNNTDSILIPPFCKKCEKQLPINSGHCPCGMTNAVYESQLQELGLSVGVDISKYKWKSNVYSCHTMGCDFTSKDPDDFVSVYEHTYTGKISTNKIQICRACHEGTLHEPDIAALFEPIQQTNYIFEDWWDSPLDKNGLPIKNEKNFRLPKLNPKKFNLTSHNEPEKENPIIPKMGKKRLFADKDEDV